MYTKPYKVKRALLKLEQGHKWSEIGKIFMHGDIVKLTCIVI